MQGFACLLLVIPEWGKCCTTKKKLLINITYVSLQTYFQIC